MKIELEKEDYPLTITLLDGTVIEIEQDYITVDGNLLHIKELKPE